MNILITVSYYSPHISGLTNSIKNLGEGLVQKGHRVSVLTTQHKKSLLFNEVINKVFIQRVPYLLKLQKGFIMPFYLFPLVKQIWKNDCVLINLPQPEGIFAAIVGRLLGKRIISVYACEVALPKSFAAFVIEQLLYFSHFVTLLVSHQVVALSEDYAEHTKLLRYFKNKTVGISPYVKKPIIVKSEISQSEKKYKIGFLGRISAEKGLEYLLESVPLLQKELGKEFVIIVAGPKAIGENLYVKKIENLVEKYEDYVSLLPPLKDDEMGAFYANLDVLVLPSINSTEAFGMVQVEAMFCGTPVVCTDLPGVRVPILKTGMGEIAKKKDSLDLAEKIVEIVKNRNAYADKKKLAEKAFDSGEIIQQYEKLLQ